MDAEGVAANAPLWRLLGHLDLGDNVAGRRVPSLQRDSGCFSDQTASAVAPDEYSDLSDWPSDSRTSAPASSCMKPVIFTSADDLHPELIDPTGKNTLNVVLPEREPIGMPSWEITDVERHTGKSLRPA